ncbi:hypothetical protein CY35_06G034900 [Sphagnum magellanicum]|nr:hypothetical protein CY35_06G034900 [Sphagnum magellanicum]
MLFNQKKSSPWQPTYKQKLGLRVTNRNIKTSAVIEAICSFCKYFGRQVDMANRKRAARIANQTYGPDFCTDALSLSEQLKFFNGILSRNNTLHWYIENDGNELTFKISNAVVDTIIGELLFQPKNEMAALEHNNGEALNPNIAERHTSCGMSFRQIAATIGHTRDVMSIGKLNNVSDHMVGQYVRVLIIVALTKISVLLSSDDVWAFSIAFDGSTHRSITFFDARICISVKGILYNFHLITMPHFNRHIADLQVKMLVTLLGALYMSWADKLIGVMIDGERTNMGHITGIQKQLVDLATHDMTQVNYVNHQADLVVQATVELIDGSDFVAKVYEAMVYLCKQNTLITEMGVASPKKTNWWAALNSVLQFDIKYERQIITFLDERLFAVAPGLELVHKMFCELQARLLLICQQRAYVNKLAVDLHMGSRVEGHFDALDDFAQRNLLTSIGMFAMSIVQGIIDIQTERNSRNEPTDKEAPPVMSSNLIRVQPVVFFRDVLEPRNVHLIKANWDEDAIYEVEQQHRDLIKAYNTTTRRSLTTRGRLWVFDSRPYGRFVAVS